MNRKQRIYAAHQAIASRFAAEEFNRRLEISTTWVLAGMILAMDQAHCKVNYEKWFGRFAEIYPEILKDPEPYVRQAEKIADADIEIHWEG